MEQIELKNIDNNLISIINMIYNNFIFLNLDQKEFKRIVIKEIKNLDKSEKDYILLIKNNIMRKMEQIVKEKLKDNKNNLTVVNNYININIAKDLSFDDNYTILKKISQFFSYYRFMPTADFMMDLIKSNFILNNILKQVVENELGNKKELNEDTNIVLLLDCYCMLNGIEFTEYEDIEHESFSDDIVSIYLKEIGSFKLLSVESEKELAKKIALGDEDAKKEMANCNLRLVVSIAKNYLNRGLSLPDLIQEGNMGLMKAIDKFDVTRNLKFSTYASYWINQAIGRSIYNFARSIRVPVYLLNEYNHFRTARTELENLYNREVTPEEIAKHMGIKISTAKELEKLSFEVISLNSPVTDDIDNELGDIIAADDEELVDIITNNDINGQIMQLFRDCDLTEREIEIVSNHFGIGCEMITLDSISNKLGITRERIRQIEARAIMKIRRSNYIKGFADYMDDPEQAIKNIFLMKEMYTVSTNKTKVNLLDDEIQVRAFKR